jgi:hypothetical protein
LKLAHQIRNTIEKYEDKTDDNKQTDYNNENETNEIVKHIADIVSCSETGGGILLYKYQHLLEGKTIENYRIIGKFGNDTSLSDYFENPQSGSFATKFLEGITYLTETKTDTSEPTKYELTSYAIHKNDNNIWIGQDSKPKFAGLGKIYSAFDDIKAVDDKANRILFIRISSYHKNKNTKENEPEEELKGEAVFVFYDNYNTKGEKPDSVYNTRYVHLLRNEISKYLKDKYRSDAFKAWVEERNKNKPIISLSHGVDTYEDMIKFYIGELRNFESCIKDNNIKNYKNVVKYVDISFSYLVHKWNLINNYTKLRDDKTIKDSITKECFIKDFVEQIKSKYNYILNFHMEEYNVPRFSDSELIQKSINLQHEK